MGIFFSNTTDNQQVSPREALQSKYNSARSNLLWVLAFTVINIVLLFADGSTYFLFSLFVPYALVLLGMLFTGRLTDKALPDELAELEALPDAVLTIMTVIAAVIILLYLISWIFSKKNRVGWLIFALVLFSIDTGIFLLIGGISVDSIVDIVFHIAVIVLLAGGISAHSKLKKLPPEEEIVETTAEVVEEVPEVIEEAIEEVAE